ncbi:hypothetical protein FRC14_004612 [Serendipita sp. 396]|nr:hypothetical protein FRC14_004612 [Serendipita sp. 396]KAG8783092.1 hypothetical protein FRC15_005806 [Serendipita sp. 397]KAG8797712.1 hypothetical protein FRC16_008594 [Serendipita sp. 398]KAG8866109.1 hypothetical protein FRC20_009073 [Serendipita sp. 405]
MSTTTITTFADAQALVKELRENPNNIEKRQLARTACSTESWPLLCDARYPDFLADCVNLHGEEEVGANGLPAWVLSAWEISISLQASNTSVPPFITSPLNINALLTLRDIIVRKLMPSMASLGAAGRVRFKPDSPDAASCISAATGLLFALSHSLKMHPDLSFLARLRQSGAVEVCTLCWLYTSDLATRVTASISLESLLEPHSQQQQQQSSSSSAFDFSSPPMQHVLRRVVDAAPNASTIVHRCISMLSDGLEKGKMTDGHKLVELCLVQWMTDESCKDSLGRFFVTERQSSGSGHGKNVAEVVVAVVADALAQAEVTGVNWEIVDMGGAVLISLSNVAPLSMGTLIEYIERLEIVQLAANIYTLGPEEEHAQAWSNLVDLLLHCTTCRAPNCHFVRTEAYENALRSKLEQNSLWNNVVHSLLERARATAASDGGGSAKAKTIKGQWAAWAQLGKELGLVYKPPPPSAPVSTLRGDVDGCWFGECERHGKVDEETEGKLLRCSACRRAKYCSSACQQKDWKAVHKTECKAFRAGTSTN